MTQQDEIIKCTRCRHKHKFSDRVEKQNLKSAFRDLVCPKCEGKVYTTLKPTTP